jgi:hypothetical protein
MITIKNDTYLFIRRPFEHVDFKEFMLFAPDETIIDDFECAFTFGNHKTGTYTEYRPVSFFDTPIAYKAELHVSLLIKKSEQPITIDTIFYDNEEIKLDDIDYETQYPTYNKHPLFDVYENNRPVIDNWLLQCTAITQMYGIEVLYFKVDPTLTIESLANNFMRSVSSVKRIKISLVNGEIPQDQHQFTEWDIMLPSEFQVHVVKDIFYNAFGNKTIPNEKDIVYIPILNRLFRVATSQNVNKMMGRSAWWEVYLQRFENDTSIDLNDIILSGEQMLQVGDIDMTLDSYIEASTKTLEKQELLTTDEVNTATERLNVLKDTTHLISLKETEILREFYHKRLKIVSVKLDNLSLRMFPMYDLTAIDISSVALTYNTENYITKNKNLNVISSDFELGFDFVSKRSTPLTFEDDENILGVFSVFEHDNPVVIIQPTFGFLSYDFQQDNIYQVRISYLTSTNHFELNIYKYDRYGKTNVYHDVKQNIYESTGLSFDSRPNFSNHTIKNLILFGGHYYIGHIQLSINDETIIDDNCRPIMVLNPHEL